MRKISFPLITTLSALASLAIAETIPEDAIWQVLDNCTLQSGSSFDNGCLTIEHGGDTFRLRMYYADPLANEADALERIEDQTRYFQTDKVMLTTAGREASGIARRFLKGSFEVVTKWEDARSSGSDVESFAFLRTDGRYLSATLIEKGLARLHAPPPFDTWPGATDPATFHIALKHLERRAQASGVGIWQHATASPQMAGAALTFEGSVSLHTGPVLDLNSASAAELAGLPGIGPALAEQIIRARPIESVDELEAIPGISARTVDGFRNRVHVRPPEALNR